MARTDRYREQHAELAKIVTDLEKELDEARLAADATQARKLLSALAGKITVHLAAEDSHLYPDLMKSGNEKLKATATKFSKDMGPIAKAFTGYIEKWPSPSAIKGDPKGFVNETKTVMGVLKDRIKKENTELYPLADTV